MVSESDFDRPREKLQTKGVASLSDTELLQLIIGSGNARASVANIARKAHKSLLKHGSAITYDQLAIIPGLGSARIGNILATFELASRYPINTDQLLLNDEKKLLAFVNDIRSKHSNSTTYITLDGAKRLIAKRTLIPGLTSISGKLRAIMAHYLSDNAANLVIVQGSKTNSVTPALDDLQFAKELKTIVTFFGAANCIFYLINQTDQHLVMDIHG